MRENNLVSTMIAWLPRARRFLALSLIVGAWPVLFAECAQNARAAEDVPFAVLGGDQCFMFSALLHYRVEGNNTVELPLEFVINDETEYRKLFNTEILRESCASVDLNRIIPDVDFSKKTVLGFWNSGSCAAVGFKRRVLRDDIQKEIIYSVSVIGSAIDCSGPGRESLNLIAIPKVPSGFKVVFENVPE